MIICYSVVFEGCRDGDEAPSLFDTGHIQNPKLKAKIENMKDGGWLTVDLLSASDQSDLLQALDKPQPGLPCTVEKTIAVYYE